MVRVSVRIVHKGRWDMVVGKATSVGVDAAHGEWVRAAALIVVLGGTGAVGCVGDASGADTASETSAASRAEGTDCQPGSALGCVCTDGMPGLQRCRANGAAYAPCDCSSQLGAAAGANASSPASVGSSAGAGAAPAAATPPGEPSMSGTDAMVVEAPDGSVPDTEHCAPVASWVSAWSAFEEQVLELTNQARALGGSCGQYGVFEPAPPLTMNARLRCSARLHSQDMGEQGYFAHDDPSGQDPFERMAAAGYAGFTMGENIAKGQQTPAEVVDGWMHSDGHCSNMLNPQYTELGVGYWEGAPGAGARINANKLWTQNFGAPRRAP